MYVLACIPIYGDLRGNFCFDLAGSQEAVPELGLGSGLAIKARQTMNKLDYDPDRYYRLVP
jgi:hypothetical protein